MKTRRTRACRHFKRAWAIEMVWALKWAWAKEISGPLLVGLTNGPKNEEARHTNGLGLRVLGFVNDTSPMGQNLFFIFYFLFLFYETKNPNQSHKRA